MTNINGANFLPRTTFGTRNAGTTNQPQTDNNVEPKKTDALDTFQKTAPVGDIPTTPEAEPEATDNVQTRAASKGNGLNLGGFFKKIGNGLKKAFDWVKDKVFEPVKDTFDDVWDWTKDKADKFWKWFW